MNKKQVVKALLSQFKFHKSSLQYSSLYDCVLIVANEKDTSWLAIRRNKEDGYFLAVMEKDSYRLTVREHIKLSWWEKRKARKIYEAVELEEELKKLKAQDTEEEKKHKRFLVKAGLGVEKDGDK